jgi:hypothetical protein
MELNQLYCCLIFCYYTFQTPTQHEGKRMITNLSSKDQDIFDKDQSSIITERVDDVPLLIGQMTKMGLQEILDRHIPRHWNRRLSWGGQQLSGLRIFFRRAIIVKYQWLIMYEI